jgi:hypothetical protein
MKAEGLAATFLAFALVPGACGGNGDAPKGATRAGDATPTTEGGAVSQNPEGWPRRSGRPDQIVGEADFVLVRGAQTGGICRVSWPSRVERSRPPDRPSDYRRVMR